MARIVFEATQEYPLNPRDLDSRSLLMADSEWIREFNLYLRWVNHKYDLLRKKNG